MDASTDPRPRRARRVARRTSPFPEPPDHTPNVGDPQADADYIYFPDYPGYGSFRVFEGRETSVELIGALSSFEFLGFGAVADLDAGFVSPFADAAEPTTFTLMALGALVAFSTERRGSRRLSPGGRG